MANRLRDKGELPNCYQIAKICEVSYKTAQRDFDLLRDFLGYPLEYDKQTYTWRLTGPLPEPVL